MDDVSVDDVCVLSSGVWRGGVVGCGQCDEECVWMTWVDDRMTTVGGGGCESG